MKTKVQKRDEARKSAEAIKAARKAKRQGNGSMDMTAANGKKGKSVVPQSKTKKK